MEATMITSSTEHLGFIEWAGAFKAHPHEHVCGDAFICIETAGGVLIAVIDGLGHGPEAALASESAVAVLAENAEIRPDELLRICHEALKGTRGAVVSIAALDKAIERLSWIGVGNVEGVLLRSSGSHEWLPLRGGIVGCRMPGLTLSSVDIAAGDLLVMFSDGIRNHSPKSFSDEADPKEIAESIMTKHLRGNDDAVVLVARYHGEGGSKG